MGPVMVSTWVQPINLTINTKFGSHLYDGAGVSAMEYSTNLYLVCLLYTSRAHETGRNLVCRLLLEKKKKKQHTQKAQKKKNI